MTEQELQQLTGLAPKGNGATSVNAQTPDELFAQYGINTHNR
jgi:hypothetical protein